MGMFVIAVTCSLILGMQSKPDLSGGVALDGGQFKFSSGDKVVISVGTQCPIAGRYAPEISRLAATYKKKGVEFYLVYPVDLGQANNVRNHLKDYGLKLQTLLDPNHSIVKSMGMKVTPEAALISREGKLLYLGKIDSRNIEHGKVREGYRRDLKVALDEYLAGKAISEPRTTAIGCFIEER